MSNTSVNNKVETTIFRKATTMLTEARELKVVEIKPSSKPALQFRDYDLPTMYSGTYEFNLEQKVFFGENTTSVDTFKASCHTVVEAPLQALEDSKIYHHYPPKRASGNYDDVLPHVVLQSKGLPWRMMHWESTSKSGVPWLALILMTEDESELTPKPGQKIKIPSHLIPSKEVLPYITHIVETRDGAERSVLISHRLPTPGKNNVAHIIALHEKADDNLYTPLFSWNFNCEEVSAAFEDYVEAWNVDLLRLPALKTPDDYEKKPKSKEKKLENKLAAYNKCLENGFVPLPHFTRNGQRIMSWYRSPLTPYDVDTTFSLRYINHSDHLLRYFSKSKRLDTTYSAAWELGRWLTLQEKAIAEALYSWKRKIALNQKQEIRREQQEKREAGKEVVATEQSLIQLFAGSSYNDTIPNSVREWLLDLVRLSPVPFCNLIPDESMLPKESLRFFHVDEGWIWALIDGALSIGRMPTAQPNKAIEVPELYLTGCIIRSNVVQIFPDFGITANGTKDEYKTLLPVVKRKIGQDVMICIFHSPNPIETLEVFLEGGETHFGLDRKYEETVDEETKNKVRGDFLGYEKKFYKLTKTADVLLLDNDKNKGNKKNLPLLDKDNNRMIKIEDLAKKMKATGKKKGSTFALRMIEAAPKVIFSINKID